MTDREPDVEISVWLRGKELRFEEKPGADVEISGEPEVSGGSVLERENLPDELEPGKTYRDFAVRWRIAARLEDFDLENE